ncbi:dihydropteroate synthase [Longirhabdus pacifica]|uniref:dihydropteroate synthase n=1 Tax=Longirhabdus pacifica TaxID=2305227 RepID=UPI001F0BBC90|nr:dihydropteroate synthase [Longirhabdus pacifica]
MKDTNNKLYAMLHARHTTLVMGILNVTPDSFSDGGTYHTVEQAYQRALTMVEQGADIIDIGGESTRPGAKRISAEEELQRVIPVVEKIASHIHVPISIDTYKSSVAKAALDAGATIVNDIWGCQYDEQMAQLAAHKGCPIILMHNRKTAEYEDVVTDVIHDLQESISLAMKAGVKEEQIILDPGIGFAKTLEHNLTIMNHLHQLTALGYPVLLGTSRKSMIQKTLSLPAHDVVEGSLATAVMGITQGCKIIRVHDVKQTVRAARMTEAIIKSK